MADLVPVHCLACMLSSLSGSLAHWFSPEHIVPMIVPGAMWNRGHIVRSWFLEHLVDGWVFVK